MFGFGGGFEIGFEFDIINEELNKIMVDKNRIVDIDYDLSNNEGSIYYIRGGIIKDVLNIIIGDSRVLIGLDIECGNFTDTGNISILYHII